MHVGDGPTADVREEHLEKANLNGPTLISGRTLLTKAKDVLAILRKAEAVAKSLLGPDGNCPSGWNMEKHLSTIRDKMLEEKDASMLEKPQANEDNDDDVEEESCVPTLTQGVKSRASIARAELRSKWVSKVIPFHLWMAAALFVKKGIARDHLINDLPVLQDVDYPKGEKQKHSRAAARKKARLSKETSHDLFEFAPKDRLIASCVSILALTGENQAKHDLVSHKRDQLRLAQRNAKSFRELIEFRIALKKNCESEIANCEHEVKRCVELQKELDHLVEEHENSAKKSALGDACDEARNMVKLVTQTPDARKGAQKETSTDGSQCKAETPNVPRVVHTGDETAEKSVATLGSSSIPGWMRDE